MSLLRIIKEKNYIIFILTYLIKLNKKRNEECLIKTKARVNKGLEFYQISNIYSSNHKKTYSKVILLNTLIFQKKNLSIKY